MKNLLCGLVALAGVVASGAANDWIVSFSTPGPDKYADGTPVADGETYALVWSKGEFAGVKADGTPVNAEDEIILAAPLAKGGRCPLVAFEVDAAKTTGDYTNGVWSVVLLDTRLAEQVDGKTVLAAYSNGKPSVVNAANTVVSTVKTEGYSTAIAAESGVQASVASALDESWIKDARITDMKIVGDKVLVTVENTVPCVQYNLASGETPGAVAGKCAEGAKNGVAGGQIILVAPKTGNTGFFRVNRN